MKVFALFNVKGGVGKTTSAVNLAWISASEGLRTLLWDLDPQAAATFTFRIRPEIDGGGPALLRGETGAASAIRGSDFPELDVLPADFSLRELDAMLARDREPEARVRAVLEPLADEYDCVFVDCAPSLSRVAESVFAAADALLVPTIPTTLSLRTLAQLMKHLKGRKGHRPRALPFFCMVDRRKGLHVRVCDWVAEQRLGFLETQIPSSSVIEQMGVQRGPLGAYAGSSPALEAYEALWRELFEGLEGADRAAPLFDEETRERLARVGRDPRRSRRAPPPPPEAPPRALGRDAS